MKGKGASKTTQPIGYASRPGSPGSRVSEGHLRLTENVLCEQRRNLKHLPRWGRRTERQWCIRGSGPVVVGGVTTTQGDGESRIHGAGVYRPAASRISEPDSNMLSERRREVKRYGWNAG